jgi:putative oxidoreductase
MTSTLYQDVAYSFMRFFAGGLFAFHGAQKLFGVFGGKVMTGVPKMLAAGIIEFAGGLLIAVGLFTAVAAFIASGEMAVAYFTVHAKTAFGHPQRRRVWLSSLCLFTRWRGSGRFASMSRPAKK